MPASRAWLPPVLVLLALLAFVGGAASAPRAAASAPPDAAVTVPAPDSPPRDAILDAVRARLGVTTRLGVDHIATCSADTAYAFVRATEIVPVEGAGEEAREGERTVMALLAQPPGADARGWRVVELWTFPEEGAHPAREFVHRVRERQTAARLPAALFPADLLDEF